MDGIQIQESARTLREGLWEGLSPADSLSVVCQSGECLRQGACCSRGSRTNALCLALMPVIQGSPKIGLGNSLKVITWDSGTSRSLLRAAPNAARDSSSAANFQDFSLFFMFISGSSIHGSAFMSTLCLFPPPKIPLFLWERKKLAPQSPLLHHRVQGNRPL